MVAKKFRETCEDVFGSATELDYDGAGWQDADVDTFVEMEKLAILDLQRSSIKKLPESIGNLKNLEKLSLIGCIRLGQLPESICECKALKLLEIKYSGVHLSSKVEQLEANGCTISLY